MCELLRAPWLAFTFADLDWNWLVRNAKLHDRQNRLGFTATLAKELAWRVGDQNRMDNLSQKERLLQPSLLAKEDTYCHDSLTRVERDWLREHRAPEARKWNMLSDLGVERLSHATSDSVPEPGAPSCKNWTRLLGRKSAWYDGWVCYHAALRVF